MMNIHIRYFYGMIYHRSKFFCKVCDSHDGMKNGDDGDVMENDDILRRIHCPYVDYHLNLNHYNFYRYLLLSYHLNVLNQKHGLNRCVCFP